MTKPKEPAYKKDQRESRVKLREQRKFIHAGGTLELGIKAFKRANPDKRKLFAEFKKNAWKSYDPKKIEVRPKPAKFEPEQSHNYQLPEGLSNHQKLVMRRAIREQIKEAQGGKVQA